MIFLLKETNMYRLIRNFCLVVFIGVMLTACASQTTSRTLPVAKQAISSSYQIGPGDVLDVFVWRNPEISITVPVRPDGKISTPLVEDMIAVGKTPTQLARDIEAKLTQFIKSPKVTVITQQFVGTFNKQVRVVGQATNPRALSYRENMTLLDVMIEVGGLTEFASGNRAKIVRRIGNKEVTIPVKIKDLMQNGDVNANLRMQPGDILFIPQSWF